MGSHLVRVNGLVEMICDSDSIAYLCCLKSAGRCDEPAAKCGHTAGAVHHTGASRLYGSQPILSTSVLLWR
jgi:hypothetical protein